MPSRDQNGHGAAVVEGLSDALHLHASVCGIRRVGSLTVEPDLPPHMGRTFATLGFKACPPRALERRTR
jgi:hypothetical protein